MIKGNQKKTGPGHITIFGGLFTLIAILAIFTKVRPFHDESGHEKLKVNLDIAHVEQARKARQNPKPKRQNQFSGYDGSHRYANSAIKEMLHDPSSFEHVDTRNVSRDGKNLIRVNYRAKNAYGATVTGTAFYETSSSGDGSTGKLIESR